MQHLIEYLSTPRGAMATAVLLLITTAIYISVSILHISPIVLLLKIMRNTTSGIGKIIIKKETKYNRDLEIGKINKKRFKYKSYRLLNDLTIDLGLKRQGVTPYELLFLLMLLSALISALIGWVVFANTVMVFLSYPIVLAAVICTFYTKANLAHDLRIDAVIEAENIISNNIKDGVVVAVRNSLDVLPKDVKTEFKDFLDAIEHENTHIRTALLDLNNKLGSISDDFIAKCITFELEEEHGIAGIFQDLVELNNIKTDSRNDMKHEFEKISTEFVMGVSMILIFLFGVIALFDVVRHFYFRTTIGQLILVADAAIIIGEFVFITWLRAQEL